MTEPLLESEKVGLDTPEPETRERVPFQDAMMVSKNLFWNWQTDKRPAFLLTYYLGLALVCEGWLSSQLTYYGFPQLAKLLHGANNLLRALSCIVFYMLQILFLCLL